MGVSEIFALLGLFREVGPDVVAALVALISALVGIFLLIPGEQPEKTLQKIVDILKRISKK